MNSWERLTFLNEVLGISDARDSASEWSATMSGFFTRYTPFICLMTSSESITNSASSSPSSMTLDIAAIRPRYSA